MSDNNLQSLYQSVTARPEYKNLNFDEFKNDMQSEENRLALYNSLTTKVPEFPKVSYTDFSNDIGFGTPMARPEEKNFMLPGVPENRVKEQGARSNGPQMSTSEAMKTLYGNVPGTTKIGDVSILPIGGNYQNTKGKAAIQALPSEKEVAVPAQSVYNDAPQVKPQTSTFDPIKDNLPEPTEYEKAMFDQAQGISKRVEDQSFNPTFYKDLAQGAINSTAGIGGSALKGAGDLYSKLGKLTSVDFYDNYGKTLQDLGEKATNYTRKNSNNSAGQKIGGIVPLAGATVADIATGGALTPAITGTFAVSGYGDGLDMYDELNKGKEKNELARTGAGLLYGSVMAGATNYLVGKAIPKGILSDAVASVFKANPELLQTGGEAVINSFAKAQPALTKQLVTNTLHGVGTMEAMELSKNAIDEIYGKHHDLKDWINTATQAAVTGAMFSAITSPFSIHAQTVANNARRESQSKVTLAFDEKGKPVEVISGNKGLTPDGKEVTIPEKNLNNAYTLTTEDFNNAIQQHKTEGKATIDDRNVFSNNVSDTLKKLSSNGTVTVAKDENGESLYVIGGGENGYKAMNLKGEVIDIPQDTPLESAHVADVHKSIMQEYDKRSKIGDVGDTGDVAKLGVGSNESVDGSKTDPEQIVNPTLPDNVNVADPNTHIQAGVNTIQAQQVMEQALKGTDFTFSTKVAEKDPETQKSVLNEVMANEKLSDPQKQSIANFMQQAAVSRQLHNARQEEISNQLQQTRESLTKQVNDKTGTLVTGTIKGDDKPIQIIKGLAVTTDETKPDNQLIADPENSDEAVYYVDENGEKQVTTPDQLDVQSSVGIDDHMNQLQQQTMQEEEMNQQTIAQGIQQVVDSNESVVGSKENTGDSAEYGDNEFVRLNDGTYGTIAGKTATGYQLESDNGTVRDINASDIIPEPQIKGVSSGDTVDYIDENGDQVSGVIQIDPTLRKQGKVFVNDVEVPIENLVGSGESVVSSKEKEPQAPKGDVKKEGDIVDGGDNGKQTAAVVPQYPVKKDGTPDFEKMNDEQTFNYLKETEGEDGAISAIKSVIKNTQNEIQKNQRAIDKFNSTKHTRQNKATTLQEIAGIKASLKSEESKLNEKKAELQGKLQGLQEIVGSGESVVGSKENAFGSNEPVVGSKENTGIVNKENIGDNGNGEDNAVNNTSSIEVREKEKTKQMNPWEKRLNNLGDYVDLEDYILRAIAGGVKLKWTGTGTNKGLGDELGLTSSTQERNLRKSIISDNGMTPQEFAHTIWDEYGGENNQGRIPGMDRLESQDVMNFVLDVANSTHTKNEALTKSEEKHDTLGLSPEDYDVYKSFTQKELNYLETLPDDILENYLGISEFTPEQLDIINNLQNEYGNTNTESTDSGTGERGEGTQSIEHRASSIESKQSGIDEQIAGQEVNTDPSEGQKEAGNYKKGHIVINGMDISVENPVGSLRKGVDEDGKAWEHEMKSHYGYFKGTVGKDGDHVDVFTKSNTPEDYNGPVYVIDQVEPSTGKFDESKVMLGYDSPAEAKQAYSENYDKDWKGFSAITEIGVDDFKKWLYDGKKQHKPFSEYKEIVSSREKIVGSKEKVVGSEENAVVGSKENTEDSGDVDDIETKNSEPQTGSIVELAKEAVKYQSSDKQIEPSTPQEVADLTGRLLSTGLAKDVKMVTPEEMTGILEGKELMHRAIGGNSGYVGYSMSKRAASARENGKYPKTDFKKEYSVTESALKSLVDSGIVNDNEWHHTSKFGNKTTFYQWEENYYPEIYSENKKEIDKLSIDKTLTASETSDRLNAIFENSPITKQVEDEMALFKLKLTAQSEILDLYTSEKNETLSKIPTKFVASDGSIVHDAGKTTSYVEKDGERLTQRYKKQERNAALDQARQYINNQITPFKEWEQNNAEKVVEIYKKYGVEPATIADNGQVQFMRKPDGTIYGFVKNGVVYLNSDKPNLNTPIHEFGHLFTPLLKSEHREFYDKGADLIKESPYYEQVKNDPNYAHLDEDGIIDEAMNQAIGDKGQKAVQDLGLFARLKQWIRGVWERIGAKFGIKNLTPEQIQDLTLEDWTDVVNSELLSGEKLGTMGTLETMKDELKKLPETININGTERPTTDSTGKPIHLTEEGVRNFWKWFGESKVVDESGRPLVVYHGTRTDFNEFKLMDSDIFGTKLGHFFTPDKNIATIFADGKIHEAYLSIKNPKEIKGNLFDKYEQYKGADAKLRKLAPKETKYDIVTLPDFKTYRESLQESGYDGIVMNNFSSKKTIKKVPQYIAFESTQIKSAIGNDGSFSSENSDIRFQIIGEKGASELDKAEEANTRMDNLKVAREMESAFEEKKAKIEKLRNSDPIEITGKEIEPGKDLKEYRKNAFEYGKNLRGEYKNEDTGAEIKVSRGSIAEVLKHSILDDGHIQSVSAIPQIIEKSILIDTLDNDDPTKHPDVKSYSYYVAGLKINGEDYTVKAVVAESKSGERYYDHKLTKIEKGKLLSTLPDIHKSGEESNIPFSDSKDKRLLSVLQTNDVKSAQKIRTATGWEKSVDGKWRYEVADGKITGKLTSEPVSISEVWDNADLFTSYPQLKEMKINVEPFNGKYSAMYYPDNNLITLYTDRNGNIPQQAESFVSHEIQHAIQDIEGFSTGSNIDFEIDNVKAKANSLTFDEYKNAITTFEKELESKKQELQQVKDSKKWNKSWKAAGLDVEINKLNAELKRLVNTTASEQEAFDNYRKSAGEVEARNVQSRLEMTPEQRREKLLSETADVSEKDQRFLREEKEPPTPKGEKENIIPSASMINGGDPEKPAYSSVKPLEQYAKEINAYNEQLKSIDQRKKDLKTEHDYKQISNTEFVNKAKKLNAEKFDIETKVKRIEAGTSKPEDFLVGSGEKVVGSEENTGVGSNESVVGSKENTEDNADGGDTGIVGSGEKVVGSNGNAVAGNGKPPKTTSMATKLAAEAGEDLPGRLRDELDEKMERGLSKLRFAIQEAYQDQHIAVKLFQDKLVENGLKITPINDWYMRVTALGGMNDSQMDAYEHRFNLPIMKEVNRMEKISSYRDIENYLMLKHGLERNDFMRAQEAAALEAEGKNIPEGLAEKDFSGITAIEEETGKPAQEYIDEFESKHDTTKLWDLINKSTTNSLKVGYDNGRISKQEFEGLINRFKYYIPLRGFDKDIAEDKYDYSPDMGTYFVAPLIKAKGRTSRPETPFAYIFSMNHSAITEGNKNNLNQIWVRLARQDKSGLLILKQSWYKKTGVTDDGLPIWEQQSPEWNADPEQYAANIQKFEEDMAALAEKDEAKQKRGKLDIGLFVKPKQAKQHEIHAYENGTEHVVYINANPKIARAINGDNRVEAGAFFEGLSTVNRWMAANFTSRNPLFMVTNFERDITFATTTLAVKEGLVYQAKFIGNIPHSVKAITNMTLGKGSVNDKYDQYANEFIMNGGKTGYTHIVEIKSVQKRIESEIKKGKIKEPLVVLRAFELGNLVAENTTRLATYITSREMGRDIAESVSNAKEVTVNFNRKGSGALGAYAMRKSFLFFNVAVQALDNMIKTTKGHPWRMAGLLASFVASGIIAPLLVSILGGDEAETAYNNLSDWDRHNNWCIWTGDGFVKWALPQELRVFHALGDNIYRHGQGKVTNTELAVNTMVGLTDLLPLNPMGAMATEDKEWKMLANTATPDLMKPWVQLALNVTYTGGNVYNQFANNADPGFVQASKNKKGEPFAPAILVWAAQETDKLSGGDGVMPGKTSPNPDIINHLLRGYMGGLYTIFIKSVDSGEKLVDGKELKVRDTPLSTLYTSKDDITENNAAMRKEYNDIKAAVKDEKHYISKYKEKAKDVYRETGDLSKTAEYIHKMTALSTKKYMAIKTLTNGITKLEGELEDAPNANELQKKANDFRKMVIAIDKARSDEEIEKIVGSR